MDDLLLMKGLTQEEQLMMMNEMSRRQKKSTAAVLFCRVLVQDGARVRGAHRRAGWKHARRRILLYIGSSTRPSIHCTGLSVFEPH